MSTAVALAAIFGAVVVAVVGVGLYHAWDLWNRRDEDKCPFGDSE